MPGQLPANDSIHEAQEILARELTEGIFTNSPAFTRLAAGQTAISTHTPLDFFPVTWTDSNIYSTNPAPEYNFRWDGFSPSSRHVPAVAPEPPAPKPVPMVEFGGPRKITL